MKTLMFAGLAGALAMTPATAFAASDSASGIPISSELVDASFASPLAIAAGSQGTRKMTSKMGGHKMSRNMRGKRMKGMHRMRGMKKMRGGHKMRGHKMRRMGRHQGRSGRNVRRGRVGYGRGYRRPHRGFQIPRSFIQPSFFIGNYGFYGLSQPSVGYGWSRYYDDAVLTDRRGVVYDARHNVNWDRYNQGYSDGYRAGQASYDHSVLYADDRVMASPSAYQRPVSNSGAVYQGDWNGAYQQDGSYQGDWQGTYRDANGRVYEGQYSGRFIGEGDVRPAGADYTDTAPHWEQPPVLADDSGMYPGNNANSDELAYLERCKKSSGIGGAVVGGAIGALAGNRIAGRGNRLGGSLIGGGLGALAGGAIEQGTDRCRKLLKKYGGRPQARAPQYRRPQYRAPAPQYRSQRAYPSGWQGYYPAYYYPQQQPMVTTVVIQSQPVTTTTTTTTIEEEYVYAKPKYVAKKRWKPAAKRVWKPKKAPAPVLKGCQQERCLYD